MENKIIEDKELYFDAHNKTYYNDIAPEYLYYKVTRMYKYIDFSEYKEVLPNGVEVISINNFHRCMLDQNEEYKNYVIEEVLYDIDRFGYYATEDIENALSIGFNILTDEFTPDDLGREEWDALAFVRDKQLEKFMNKDKKCRSNKKLYKR